MQQIENEENWMTPIVSYLKDGKLPEEKDKARKLDRKSTRLNSSHLARSIEVRSILVLGDSQLIIGQINGTYEAKEGRMKKYLEKVLRLEKKFKEANFVRIPRKENVEADTLAKEASTTGATDEFDEV